MYDVLMHLFHHEKSSRKFGLFDIHECMSAINADVRLLDPESMNVNCAISLS